MKKSHPCGGDIWEIIRYGADVKLICTKCKRVIMLPRHKFINNVKKVVDME